MPVIVRIIVVLVHVLEDQVDTDSDRYTGSVVTIYNQQNIKADIYIKTHKKVLQSGSIACARRCMHAHNCAYMHV